MALQLPQPVDPRARKVASLLAANPKAAMTLGRVAKQVGPVLERFSGCSPTKRR